MFYCEPCQIENVWPESLRVSRGQCEVCTKYAVCFDTPSKYLPLPVPEPTQAEISARQLGEQHDTGRVIPEGEIRAMLIRERRRAVDRMKADPEVAAYIASPEFIRAQRPEPRAVRLTPENWREQAPVRPVEPLSIEELLDAPVEPRPDSWSRRSLLRWWGGDAGLPMVNPLGQVSAGEGRHYEYTVALVCPGRTCTRCRSVDREIPLNPSYSPFTDPFLALDHARWQADHNYGSEHKPVLRVRTVTNYEELS